MLCVFMVQPETGGLFSPTCTESSSFCLNSVGSDLWNILLRWSNAFISAIACDFNQPLDRDSVTPKQIVLSRVFQIKVILAPCDCSHMDSRKLATIKDVSITQSLLYVPVPHPLSTSDYLSQRFQSPKWKVSIANFRN